MFRIGVACVVLSVISGGAMAEAPAERGGYLVNTIMACGNCHTPRDTDGKTIPEKAFSGGMIFTTPAFIATAPNITPDVETGIGSWSDAEIKRALVQGMRPDHGRLAGAPLAAIMPANFYKALLPDDLDAIVAYLHTIKPIRNEVADPVYKAPARRDPYPDAEAGFSKTMFVEPVGRGAYLVTIGHCMECHSAWSRGVSDFKNGLGRGGRIFPAPDGSPGSIAANITSDPTAGIGGWTDREIARAVTEGIGRDGRKLRPPMAYGFYAGLKQADLADIIAWLRTVPPLQ
ncbi:c-type cytochrome [Bradyrhizobium erythrophlei]|uniref:Cytochrome c n=1 Tax=Bradyrhizobium erythrophlei TaxID=1437360 RepID=A0A1M5KQZ7_9BRAD|nr:c-type cytochrome [Bradyrhizobium erythrophlei]SHG55207.1 Cytochrome c [Bradyrhizobium erythrophlei]